MFSRSGASVPFSRTLVPAFTTTVRLAITRVWPRRAQASNGEPVNELVIARMVAREAPARQPLLSWDLHAGCSVSLGRRGSLMAKLSHQACSDFRFTPVAQIELRNEEPDQPLECLGLSMLEVSELLGVILDPRAQVCERRLTADIGSGMCTQLLIESHRVIRCR
jgi:hypothetical protein